MNNSNFAETNYYIVYNNERFMVDPVIFQERSEVFASYYDPNQNSELVVKGEYPNEAFQTFLDALNGDNRTLSQFNVGDVESLADQWSSDYVKQIISDFLKQNVTPDILLNNTIERISNYLSVSDLFPMLVANIRDLIRYPQFQDLPYALVRDILIDPNCPPCSSSDIFNATVGICDKNVTDASILFSFVDFNSLGDHELDIFFSNPNINRNLVGKPLLELSKNMFNRIKSERDTCKHLEDEVNRLSKISRPQMTTTKYVPAAHQNPQPKKSHKKGKDKSFGVYVPPSDPVPPKSASNDTNNVTPQPQAPPPAHPQAPPLVHQNQNNQSQKQGGKKKKHNPFVYVPEKETTNN